MWSSLYVYVSLCLSSCFLQTHLLYWIRDHPNDLTLSQVPGVMNGIVHIRLKFVYVNPVSSVIILGGGTFGK